LQEQEESTFSQPSNQNSTLSLTLDDFQCTSDTNFGVKGNTDIPTIIPNTLLVPNTTKVLITSALEIIKGE